MDVEECMDVNCKGIPSECMRDRESARSLSFKAKPSSLLEEIELAELAIPKSLPDENSSGI
jgi:hypothetical protein